MLLYEPDDHTWVIFDEADDYGRFSEEAVDEDVPGFEVLGALGLDEPVRISGSAVCPVAFVWAAYGYGPRLYEVAMLEAKQRGLGAGIMPGDRVSGRATRIWQRFYERPDVIAHPMPETWLALQTGTLITGSRSSFRGCPEPKRLITTPIKLYGPAPKLQHSSCNSPKLRLRRP